MITILEDKTITYTKDDAFELTVELDGEINAEDRLKLVIAKDETSTPRIENTYALNEYEAFYMSFSNEDKKALDVGDYKYKIVLMKADGRVITQQSGDFIVKWGA